MSVENIAVVATLDRRARPALNGGPAVAKMIEFLSQEALAPLAVRGRFGDRAFALSEEDPTSKWKEVKLWHGENVGLGSPLTRLDSPPGNLARELQEILSSEHEALELTLTMAIRHRPPLEDCPIGWYGRLIDERGRLLHLVQLTVQWYGSERSWWFDFLLGGYPLTSLSPRLADGARMVPTPDVAAVEKNRRLLLGNIFHAASLLEAAPGDIEWTIDYEDAMLAKDRRALRRLQDELNQKARG
jgi:hypothetical protein